MKDRTEGIFTLKGYPFLSEGFWGEGALQRLPTTIGVSKEHVLDEPLPGTSLLW